MNPVDKTAIEFFEGFSRKSWAFDNLVLLVSDTDFIKGGVVLAVLWGLWFARHGEAAVVEENRRTILATFAGSLFALSIGLVLTNNLPLRIRPVLDPELGFIAPYGVDSRVFTDWSSFPSDHATLFSGLATGIFMVSRPLGCVSILYVLTFILLPRIYLGFHFPTDILAGILIGAASVWSANRPMVKKRLTDLPYDWSGKYPALFYGMSFLLSFELAELFDNVRFFGKGLLPVASAVFNRIF